MHKASIPGVYSLIQGENPLPLVFDSPHSGTDYPVDFDYICDFTLLEAAEDKYVEDLFAAAPNYGAALLTAHFPRSYIDVNRCERDIDHDLLEDIWPEESSPSPRSFAGIGLIRRLVKPGVPLYNRQLSAAEIRTRIDTYYRPYHTALKELLDEAHYHYGQVWHVNCHSMPAQSNFMGRRGMFQNFPSANPDFVLGDRDGTTCSIDFTHALRNFLHGLGYRVAINDPYKGVELVQRYSSPAEGRHSIQIEISKALYMHEDTNRKSKKFDHLKADINKLIAFCTDYVQSQLMPMAAD